MIKGLLSKYILLMMTFTVWSGLNAQEDTIPELLEKYNDETVEYITADSLQNQYHEFIVLDTRTKKEYEVSHLPGAIWVGPRLRKNRLPQMKPNQKVVVYCTVGVRSEDFGEQLLSEGFKNVFNLYGSIFYWKDAGHEVVDMDGKATEKVHTYSKKWSRYLNTGEKVY